MNIGNVIEIALTVEVSPSTPLGQAMINTLNALANNTDNSLQTLPIYAQDCHVRIGNNSTNTPRCRLRSMQHTLMRWSKWRAHAWGCMVQRVGASRY